MEILCLRPLGKVLDIPYYALTSRVLSHRRDRNSEGSSDLSEFSV